MKNQDSQSTKDHDILYRDNQYAKWQGIQVSIPIDMDPDDDRLKFVKTSLKKKGVKFAANQVKFGKLRLSKTVKK